MFYLVIYSIIFQCQIVFKKSIPWAEFEVCHIQQLITSAKYVYFLILDICNILNAKCSLNMQNILNIMRYYTVV